MNEYQKLRRQFGLVECAYGKNDKDQVIIVSINLFNAIIRTVENDRVRVNTYWKDGTSEETYELERKK